MAVTATLVVGLGGVGNIEYFCEHHHVQPLSRLAAMYLKIDKAIFLRGGFKLN